MTKTLRPVLAVAVLAVGVPVALAAPPEGTPGKGHSKQTQSATPGPNASPAAKAKAYGVYCKSFSKKHVKGQKGTPFSRCVTAMARAANGQATNPAKACKGFSKKKAKGTKGKTPYSKCVSAYAKLMGKHGTTGPTGPTGSTGPTGPTGSTGPTGP